MVQQFNFSVGLVVLDFASGMKRPQDGRYTHVETERVQQREVVFDTGTAILRNDRDCDPVAQLPNQGGHWRGAGLQECIDRSPDLGFVQKSCVICANVGYLIVLWEGRKVGETLQVLRNRRAFGICAQDDVS